MRGTWHSAHSLPSLWWGEWEKERECVFSLTPQPSDVRTVYTHLRCFLSALSALLRWFAFLQSIARSFSPYGTVSFELLNSYVRMVRLFCYSILMRSKHARISIESRGEFFVSPVFQKFCSFSGELQSKRIQGDSLSMTFSWLNHLYTRWEIVWLKYPVLC